MMVSPIASAQQCVCDGGARVWRHLRSAMIRLAMLALMGFAAAAPATAGCDDDERPATPISLKANPLGSGGIMLQWSSNVGHYDIAIRDKQGRPVPEAPDIVGGATNENYHEFYGLQPDKEYFFSMRARTEGGTQGCISKNASVTVSAKTDTADLNKTCSNYAQTAMEEIQEMSDRQCQLPGNPYAGNWATSEGTHFLYCLEQKRAGLQGDAYADWSRHQDLQACKEHANKCQTYRNYAVSAARQNRVFGCGYSGARWTFSGSAHYSWCMGLSADSSLPRRETRARTSRLRFCRAKKASPAEGSGGGDASACTGAPDEWTAMLKAHNDLRAQYCGAPLAWNCDLAAQAKSYAEKCILDQHGANGENMADEWSSDDAYPAATDAKAFEDVWGCEKDEFHFDNPEIVGGFKENCHQGKDGQKPVNGHFTQIVWRSNTMLGCGRAKCPMKDSKGTIHQGTHWVCRYLPGGNDPGALTDNVRQPPCANAFHSLSVATCFGGMVLTRSGNCQCPPGQRWRGRRCSEDRINSSPTTAGIETCPRSRPVGSPPNCCPEGTIFENGVCRMTRSTSGRVCPRDRPKGTYPNCCPAGTFYSSGLCRSEGAGTSAPRCTGDRPIGLFPNCCPNGTFYSDGKCRTGGGGANSVNPGGSKTCPARRPVGIYPNCCPAGTVFSNGACRRGSGGADGVVLGGSKTCPVRRPVGIYPNCCPAGTNFQNGRCVNPTSQTTKTTPGSSPQSDTPVRTCTGGRIGRPPHCRCPAGTRYMGNRCLRIPTTKPNATCPTGLTGPNCDQIIVK